MFLQNLVMKYFLFSAVVFMMFIVWYTMLRLQKKSIIVYLCGSSSYANECFARRQKVVSLPSLAIWERYRVIIQPTSVVLPLGFLYMIEYHYFRAYNDKLRSQEIWSCTAATHLPAWDVFDKCLLFTLFGFLHTDIVIFRFLNL